MNTRIRASAATSISTPTTISRTAPAIRRSSGVTIQLLNSTGQVIATTQTNASGAYTFSQLTPGTYSVRELQPNGYYYEDAVPGSVGGTASDDHDLTQIALPMAANAQNYNFWVLPPGDISGYVYYDANDDGTYDARTRRWRA